MAFEIGIYTIGDHFADPLTGYKPSTTQRIKQIVDMAVLADNLGFDCFGVGEGHQSFFTTQAHSVILGAIAAKTQNITLLSSSSALTSVDPVRLFEEFSTLDHLSDGRIEMVVGRASRLDEVDLFGIDSENFDKIYNEKLELLLKLNSESVVTWEGVSRNALHNIEVLPRPYRSKLIIHRAVGSKIASALQTGQMGMNMMVAAPGGHLNTFKESIESYRKQARLYRHDPMHMKVSIAVLCHVASTNTQAVERFMPYLQQGYRALRRSAYPKEWLNEVSDVSQIPMIGDVESIIEKFKVQIDTYRHHRSVLHIDLGGMPQDIVNEIMTTLAREVIPVVKAYAAMKGI